MPNVNEDRPSYVRFERQAIEDRPATLANGHYTTKDVDMAVVTPIGSKDEIPMFADEWLKLLDQQVREERMPAKWRDQYKDAYNSWKRGQEVPVNGTPIRGWQMVSPAQAANIIAVNILTVEDLAQANGEAIQRLGMGGLALKQKAAAWLDAAKNAGGAATQIVKLTGDVKRLEAEKAGLLERNQELSAELTALRSSLEVRKEGAIVTS